MVKKMNKQEFVKKLQEETNYSNEKCILINDILENSSLFGKNNKEKIITELINNSFSKEEAENIYNITSNIIKSEIKNKIKHPFKK